MVHPVSLSDFPDDPAAAALPEVRRGQRWIVRLAGWSDGRGGIFLFVIPLDLALIGLRGLFEAHRSWADFLWYANYFVIGYIMSADKRFTDAKKQLATIQSN
jgi:hypothetical protein